MVFILYKRCFGSVLSCAVRIKFFWYNSSNMAKGGKKMGVAYVVAVNMGYGHERPANVLKYLAKDGQVTIANDYDGIPEADRKLWEGTRKLYEKISRFKKVPVLGPKVFGLMDELQQIQEFYPRRDLSAPSLQLMQIYTMIRRRNWNKALIEKLAEDPLPLLCTFMTPAFAAEEFGYPEDIWVLCTDADINRAWAPKDPKRSRIKYLAPNGRVKERLQLYGVSEKNIELTGFSLPKEAIGGVDSKILKKNLQRRLCNLDPNGIFLSRFIQTIEAEMGKTYCNAVRRKKASVVHLAFAVGGAGAQREIGIEIAKSLKSDIRRGRIHLTLVAGVRPEVKRYFEDQVRAMGLARNLKQEKGISVLYKEDRAEYFDAFSNLMNDIDILWTKPSELSFYTGLGIPVIMAPTVGSQEDFNRMWLQQVGGGVEQLDPKYTNEWLFDWIHSGALARMAWHGYTEAPTHGTYRIEDLILGRPNTIHPHPLVV